MQDQFFSLKFGASICKVVLNLYMKIQLDRAKPAHVEPDLGLHHQIIM
jgi:hypothetical protein